MMTSSAPLPDIGLMAELLEQLDRDPAHIGTRQILAEHYAAVGWEDEARAQVADILLRDPGDPEALRLAARLTPRPATPAPAASPSPPEAASSRPPQPRADAAISPTPPPGDAEEVWPMYREFREAMMFTQGRMRVLEALRGRRPRGFAWVDAWLDEGKNSQADASTLVAALSALERDQAVDAIVEHLVALSDNEPDEDAAREMARRAVDDIKARDKRPELADQALMHFEHETLHRKYVCCGAPVTDTMCAEPVEDIPRAFFWVSEDGHPWDMRELAVALEAAGLRFNNPMTQALFTERDVAAILAHPEGRRLRVAQAAQAELKRGLRPDTCTRLKALGHTFYTDATTDFAPSFAALDAFMLYQARLPESERRSLSGYVVQVVDSHTGGAWHGTIGDVLRQVRANTLCVHKAGDFLRQTAKHFGGK